MSEQKEGAEAGVQSTVSDQASQFVVFRLGEEEYAAPILDIQEIIPAGDITPFPNAPEYVSGIINVRGTVATVVSLAKLFHLPQSTEKEGYIILTKTDKALFGVKVDEVSSVMRFEPEAIRSAEGVQANIDFKYIMNVAVVNERVILILDLHLVLNEEEQNQLAKQEEVASSPTAPKQAEISPTPAS